MGLGSWCDFPRWHVPAAQRAGRQLACRALAGERTAAEERELKFPSRLSAGGHRGKRDWEGAPWAHRGWDRAAQGTLPVAGTFPNCPGCRLQSPGVAVGR